MKYLKKFENVYDPEKLYDVKVGDYVIVIKAYQPYESSFPVKIQNGDRCKVISDNPRLNDAGSYVVIENEDGEIEEYRRSRIVPELEYQSNKYNL